MVLATSSDDGAHWTKRTGPAALSVEQDTPSITLSRWTDASVQERMNAAWVGFSYNSSGAVQLSQLEAAASSNGGASWDTAVVAVPADSTVVGQVFSDVSITSGPKGVLAISYKAGGGAHAVLSLNHGLNWSAPLNLDVGNAPLKSALLFDPRDSDGKALIYAYLAIGAGGNYAVFLSFSTDYGVHWSAGAQVSDPSDAVFWEPLSLAFDAARGLLYVGYTSASSATGDASHFPSARVATVDLTQSPITALRTATVNDDGAGCTKHTFTQVGVDGAGRVIAVFFDDREPKTEASGRKVGRANLWMAVSANQGESFGTNRLMTTQDFAYVEGYEGAFEDGFSPPSLLVGSDGAARAVWHDLRTGNALPYYAKAQP
jgi:hypothetical protein